MFSIQRNRKLLKAAAAVLSALCIMAVSILRRRMRHPDYPCMKLLLGGKLIIRNSTKALTKVPEEQP